MVFLRSIILLCFVFSTSLTAAKVRILGVDAERSAEYKEKLKPRLQFISSRPATSWRADDAAFYLKRLFIRDGFANAHIRWEISGAAILLHVTAGERYLYGTVTSSQLSYLDDEDLTNYFYQPLVEGELVSIKEAPYIKEYTEKGVINVESYLKSKGFWNAQVSLAHELLEPSTKRVHIALNIYQGKRHTLTTPVFRGVSSQTKQQLTTAVQHLIGKSATTKRITQMNAEVVSYFRKTGFHFASIKADAQHNDSTSSLIFTIDQGKRYRMGDVIVEGNKTTEAKRIKRHFNKMRHRDYNAEKADEATSKLLSSGIFRRVIVTPRPRTDGKIDLHVFVEEGKTVTTKAYIGIDSYEGLVLGTSYTDLNFGGKMRQLNIRGEYTELGLLGEVGITEPFFAGENIIFNLRAFALRRTPDGYHKDETGLEASWTWDPKNPYSARFYASSALVNTSSSSMTSAELGPADYLNTRVGLLQEFDFRNDPVLPNKGYHGQLLTEFGVIQGNAETSYFKIETNNSYRIPLHRKTYLISSFSAGIIKPADSSDFPIDRRFFSGGANSVRSFDERELGPQSLAGDPLGGESYWNGSAELVRQIKEPFNLALFYDVGQVYDRSSDLDFSDPSQAIGLSARLHLPIGPIRLEYGYNLNRKRNEPAGTFHFTIGASF